MPYAVVEFLVTLRRWVEVNELLEEVECFRTLGLCRAAKQLGFRRGSHLATLATNAKQLRGKGSSVRNTLCIIVGVGYLIMNLEVTSCKIPIMRGIVK